MKRGWGREALQGGLSLPPSPANPAPRPHQVDVTFNSRWITPQSEAGMHWEPCFHKHYTPCDLYGGKVILTRTSARRVSAPSLPSAPQDRSAQGGLAPYLSRSQSWQQNFLFLEKVSTPSTTKIILQVHVHRSLQQIPFADLIFGLKVPRKRKWALQHFPAQTDGGNGHQCPSYKKGQW